MRRGRLAGLLAITVTSVVWGTTGTAATLAPGVGPLAIGAAALGIGGLLQAAVAVPAVRTARPVLRQHRAVVVTGAIAVAVYPLAFYSSMHTAGVAVGSVVSLASAPLASGVLERLVDGRALNRWWMLAAGLGILGSALLCVSKIAGHSGSAASTVLGIGLGLVAGATYAIYSWACHRLMNSGVSRAASMGAVFGGGGLLLMPVLAITGAPLLATPQAFAVGAYMALVPMFLGYLLFGHGLTRVPASTATTVTLTEPAIATVLAVLIVGERLTTLGWAGLAIIAVVLVILALAPTNTHQPEDAPWQPDVPLHAPGGCSDSDSEYERGPGLPPAGGNRNGSATGSSPSPANSPAPADRSCSTSPPGHDGPGSSPRASNVSERSASPHARRRRGVASRRSALRRGRPARTRSGSGRSRATGDSSGRCLSRCGSGSRRGPDAGAGSRSGS